MEIGMRAINAAYFQEFINNYKAKQEERANKGLGLEYFGPREMQMLLDKILIIEVELVRHGRWIPTRPYMYSVKCSICGKTWELETPRCPSCGAKMDLEEATNE